MTSTFQSKIIDSRLSASEEEVMCVLDELSRFSDFLNDVGLYGASRFKPWWSGVAIEMLGFAVVFTGKRVQPIEIAHLTGAVVGMALFEDFEKIFSIHGYQPSEDFLRLKPWFKQKESELVNYIDEQKKAREKRRNRHV